MVSHVDDSKNRMTKLNDLPPESMTLKAQLDELIAYKQSQLAGLNQQLTVAQIELTALKERALEQQREAKTAQAAERMHFEKSLRSLQAGLESERHSLESLRDELQSRQKDVELLEAQAAPVQTALRRLADERLAVEQQRMRNVELQQANEHLMTSIETSQEELLQLKFSLKTQQDRLTAQLHEQEARQQVLDAQQKDIAMQIENLAALKTTLDPKLAEVTAKQAQAERDLTQVQTIQEALTAQQAQVDKQRTDLAILSSQLQAKSKALTEYDDALKRTDTELRIKLQQAGLTTVTMPPPPATA